MENETRAELDRLHERVTRMRERVANLEAQQPHINAALLRIETNVEKLAGHLTKAMWIVLALFIGAVWRLVAIGAIPGV